MFVLITLLNIEETCIFMHIVVCMHSSTEVANEFIGPGFCVIHKIGCIVLYFYYHRKCNKRFSPATVCPYCSLNGHLIFQAMLGTLAAMIGSGMVVRSIPYQEGFGAKQLAWIVHSGIIGAVIAPLTLLGGPVMMRAALYTAGVVGSKYVFVIFNTEKTGATIFALYEIIGM